MRQAAAVAAAAAIVVFVFVVIVVVLGLVVVVAVVRIVVVIVFVVLVLLAPLLESSMSSSPSHSAFFRKFADALINPRGLPAQYCILARADNGENRACLVSS